MNRSLKSMKRKIRVAAAGAALTIMIAAGAGCGKQVTNAQPQPTPTKTELASPSAQPSAETSPSSTEMQSETFEQQTSVEAMDAMSIEDFAKLSFADRAAYAYLKNPKMNVASPGEAFDPTIIPGFYWQQLRIDAIGTKNTTEGAKTLSALNYSVIDEKTGEISSEYQAAVDSVIQTGGEGVGIADALVYVSHGVTQSGPDPEGNNIEYTNITYQDTDATDKPIGLETTAQVLEVVIKLDDGRTVVTYPRMYSIDGKKSPVEGYPY